MPRIRFLQLSTVQITTRVCFRDFRSFSSRVSILENEDLLQQIPLQDVRNWCFIAHIDHGKSSLSSRILELTGNLGTEAQEIAWKADQEEGIKGTTVNRKNKERIELLDTLSVEKERGITVKASTASMLYRHPSAVGPTGTLLVNMFDLPGHVDFGREVSRTLHFVQGAVLLLDAAQGIQAQTWSVHEKVQTLPQPPHLLVALTKVDLGSARPLHVALTVAEWLKGIDPDSILYTSARQRKGIRELLDAVCEQVPPPQLLEDDVGDDSETGIMRAVVVDSWYDVSRGGVQCLVQIRAGKIEEGDRISMVTGSPDADEATSKTVNTQSYPVQEVGMLLPHSKRTGLLRRGQMGYVRFGLKDPRQAIPGTILVWSSHVNKDMVLPQISSDLASFKSVLYATVHPEQADDGGFEALCNAVDRLALNDTGLEVQKTSSMGKTSESGGPFLGPGLRVGFQGLLHADVFRQRLKDEFGIEALVTPPKVPYTIQFLPDKNRKNMEPYTQIVEDLSEWPDFSQKFKVLEPIVDVRIIARANEDTGPVLDLLTRKRATEIETQPLDEEKWLFTAKVPWAGVVTDFDDQLKTLTAGYGSLDTSTLNPDSLAVADVHKVEIMLNGEAVEPLSFVCHRDSMQSEGRAVCKKLQEVLPRQQFVIVIQAKAAGRIIASERVKAYRKDVLTKSGKTVGGGDQTRKMKLLEKQKKGKKRLQEYSENKVTLSQAAFNSVISRTS
ncbi:hypothetical protein FisN_5Hh041 [Fistulifera solaris]|uniref:Tr-type G domain-containing protein n=1 Tax=Fistulifera solaris TaxID=1519565 RepID=A0A1Z5JUE7_FISSO|nr:hypothetical protein FisN_5Hh041 [Fistulifera solaris]|eukprot:GAX17398.1 hypothetical protein FisN_5Hh041 [Fistulifera solaris]